MKKFILMAVMAILGLQAQAQIVSSRSSMVTKEPKNGWSTFGIEYLPSSLNPDKGDSQSFTGIGLTWTKATSIMQDQPIFLEAGIGLQYSFYSESENEEYYNGFGYSTYETEENWKMASLKVPVNVIYSYQVPNTNISVDPYLGLRFRFNVYGEVEEKADGDSESYNLFDKDDMGSSDDTWNRFQLGWQIGVKARFNNSFYVGVAYGSDFGEVCEKVKVSETQLSLGFVF